jgi:hypothetical protein
MANTLIKLKYNSMEKILNNLALIHLTNFGKENKIDISGTHIVKNGRGFKYSLCQDNTGLAILTIIFNKNSVPNFFINPDLIKN